MGHWGPRAACFVVFVVAACSGSGGGGRVELPAPCDLLTAADAEEVLGEPVEPVDFTALLETESSIAPGDATAVDAAADRHCLFSAVGDTQRLVSVQVDRGLPGGEEQFRQAWGEDDVILDEPGLAAVYTRSDEGTTVTVLLDDEGAGFTLLIRGLDRTQAEITDLATELADRV